ncbi:MAG: YhfC family intramembrane metalloprotease [Oscillospiraceae bacterium]|nr:YhfC family intramembrane metalloprotease [Oscillospiraceae bacterium]
MIPTSAIVWMGITAAWCTLLPVGLLIWWRRTRKAKLLPCLVGALVVGVFARVLEALLHMACLIDDNPVSRAINGNVWLYTLYGSLAAGVFEETGRYVAFRFLLTKKRYPERDTAVSCGIGHGGIESVLMVGALFALYAVLAALQRSGDTSAMLPLTGGDAALLAPVLEQLRGITPGACVLSMIERAFAIVLHISLSVFVFLAVRDRTQRSWFPFAVALHAVADAPAALYQKGVVPMWAAELWLAVVSLYALRSARKCYLEAMDP